MNFIVWNFENLPSSFLPPFTNNNNDGNDDDGNKSSSQKSNDVHRRRAKSVIKCCFVLNILAKIVILWLKIRKRLFRIGFCLHVSLQYESYRSWKKYIVY